MDSILIIDDEPQIRKLLSRMMELEGYEVFQATDCQSTLKQLKLHTPQVALCDVFLPDGHGVDLVLTMKKLYPELEIILLTAHGNIPDGVQAIKNGAFDYITKGDDNNKIIPVVSRAMEQAKKNIGEKAKPEEAHTYSFETIKGKSNCMQQTVALAQKVAATDVTVLLTGETGTGKEVVANHVYQASKRHGKPFVKLNCAAVPYELMESELFGYEEGAFTGARKGGKKGLFEQANGGTILLDEINSLNLSAQAKLLRVLQEHVVTKVGGGKQIPIDVRVIAISNRPLQEMVEEGTFREDLYYRLNVLHIQVPPLRKRLEDIPELVHLFVEKCNKEMDKHVDTIDPKIYVLLKKQNWPGNVRQLQNWIERSMATVWKKMLSLANFYWVDTNPAGNAVGFPLTQKLTASGKQNLSQIMSKLEQEIITNTLSDCGGNKTQAAQILGISRQMLHRKLKEFQE